MLQKLKEDLGNTLETSLTISIVDYKLTQNGSPRDNGPDIYSEIEVTYLATLIKKKIERNKTLPI